jgi:hypothetical protein
MVNGVEVHVRAVLRHDAGVTRRRRRRETATARAQHHLRRGAPLMPMSTVLLPIGITSPPSSEARPSSSRTVLLILVRVPELEIRVDEHRVPVVNGGPWTTRAGAPKYMGFNDTPLKIHDDESRVKIEPGAAATGSRRVHGGQRMSVFECSRRSLRAQAADQDGGKSAWSISG